MPAGKKTLNEKQEEECWRGSDGAEECEGRGMKTEREDASSLNMYT